MKAAAQPGRIAGMAILTSFLLVSCAHLQRHEWPVIKEVSVRHHFAANRESEQLKTMIRDLSGKPLYCLDARFCWRDYETGDYDFSGALDCRLYPVDGSSHYPTLLQNNVNATRDWETYGRFTSEDLAGLVGSDASRSIVQRCWVRGMVIKIEVFNVKKEKEGGAIKSLDMIFTAKNDPAATAEVAAQTRIDPLKDGP